MGRIVFCKAEGPLKFAAEPGDFGGDFWRLLFEGVQHLVPHFRLEPDQFHRRHNQRELIIDFMTHVRELLIQFDQLLRREGHGRFGRGHWGRMPPFGLKNQARKKIKKSGCAEKRMPLQLAPNTWEGVLPDVSSPEFAEAIFRLQRRNFFPNGPNKTQGENVKMITA